MNGNRLLTTTTTLTFRFYSRAATANGGASFTDTAAKLLAEFQIKAKETVRSGTGGGQLSLLEGLKVKLPSEKGNAVPLPKLCTLNVIDAQKAELLVVDEAVSE